MTEAIRLHIRRHAQYDYDCAQLLHAVATAMVPSSDFVNDMNDDHLRRQVKEVLFRWRELTDQRRSEEWITA